MGDAGVMDGDRTSCCPTQRFLGYNDLAPAATHEEPAHA